MSGGLTPISGGDGLEDAGAAAGFGVVVTGIDDLADPVVQQFDGLGVADAFGDGRHFALGVAGVFHSAGDDGAPWITWYDDMLPAAGAAAGSGGFLTDAVAGVDLAVVVQVIAGIRGRAFVVVAMLAVHFQVGPQT